MVGGHDQHLESGGKHIFEAVYRAVLDLGADSFSSLQSLGIRPLRLNQCASGRMISRPSQ
jgi:hypothetical protein